MLAVGELYHKLKKAFWLYFYVNGSGTEWLDIGLPIPTYLQHATNGYFIGYAIDGYFATSNGKKYLNDVSIRFLKTFSEQNIYIERLPYRPYFWERKYSAHINPVVYRLADISKYLLHYYANTKAPKKEAEALAVLYRDRNTEDALFDAIRFAVYDFVRANGKNCLTLEYVETIAEIAYEQIGSKKGWSTAKAKAKAIYNWVMENYNPGGVNNWSYTPKYKGDPAKEKELMMTRVERAKANAKAIKEKKRKLIVSAVTGLMRKEYVKKDGTWNIYKLAKDLGMSRNTIMKHINELVEEGIIPQRPSDTDEAQK